ncbi:VOC family protein [Pseudooceanicola sp. CBS1P-1]|uniref:VOC family protein n=1 Tax=Pseudooceanicola albus TaxID=2692189 RepID=A0A6L7FWR2_9RHOB|nr:VOC family protein [Pseudooceanicola endophyticus]MXN16554.1 VOC family protein [Pseudooceanicola albus]
MAELDHLVVAAKRLDDAVAHVEALPGMTMHPGGVHPMMATHNAVLGTGAECYLEAIAPQPGETAPRPRWFALDRAPTAPRLVHWVARIRGLREKRALLPPENGPVIEGRRGAMRWLICVPEDGSLPFDGCFPTFIDWDTEGEIPTRRMPESAMRLSRLEIRHPEAARLQALLAPLIQDARLDFVTDALPSLAATYDGPEGPVVLR